MDAWGICSGPLAQQTALLFPHVMVVELKANLDKFLLDLSAQEVTPSVVGRQIAPCIVPIATSPKDLPEDADTDLFRAGALDGATVACLMHFGSSTAVIQVRSSDIPLPPSGMPPLPFVRSSESEVFVAAIEHIPIPTSKIDWDLVLEFRADRESQRKVAALREWLLNGVQAGSIEHAREIVGDKIDKYQAALRKHGIDTVVGCFKCLIDAKSLSAAGIAGGAGSILANPIVGGLMSGIVLGSNVVLHLVEQRRKLHELKRSSDGVVEVYLDFDALRRKAKRRKST